MLVYAVAGGRSAAGFEALCFEPENEADCVLSPGNPPTAA